MVSSERKLRIMSRQAKVAKFILRGTTNTLDIVAALGMEPSQYKTIRRDINKIRDEWRESRIKDYGAVQSEELAKLEELEREYWAAWERSKVERKHTRTKRKTGAKQDDGASKQTDEAEVKKIQVDGNPDFLDGVLRCIAKRCDILGLTRPGETRNYNQVNVVGVMDWSGMLSGAEVPPAEAKLVEMEQAAVVELHPPGTNGDGKK